MYISNLKTVEVNDYFLSSARQEILSWYLLSISKSIKNNYTSRDEHIKRWIVSEDGVIIG